MLSREELELSKCWKNIVCEQKINLDDRSCSQEGSQKRECVHVGGIDLAESTDAKNPEKGLRRLA